MKKTFLLMTGALVLAGFAWLTAARPGRGPFAKVPAKEGASGIVYHGNTSSRVFHHPSCKYYHSKACVEVFRHKEEAMRSGFKPCTICNPA
jgi:hypothetical protein